MHWIYENSSYPVRIIVPHLSKIWWYITVTTFKWLRNKSSLVQDKKTGLTRGCYAHTVKFRSYRLNEHNFEFTTFFASYIRDYLVGAWTAVNKQISMRYQGADIAPQASIIIFDRFSPSQSLINTLSNTRSMTL